MNKKLLLVLSLIVVSALVLSGCNSLPFYFSTYSAKGTVTNSSGAPIEGATISFSNGDTPVQSRTDGTWYKTGLGGTVIISVHKNGYTFTPTEYTVETEKNNLNFQSAEKKITLAGLVLDSTDNPISNISIQFGNGADSAATDSNGEWSKTLIIEDSVTATPQDPDYSFSPESLTLSGSDLNVDFIGTAN